LANSGRTIEEVAKDLGIGRSSLSKWKSQFREAELFAGPHDDVHQELARLRGENELLRAEQDLLKKRPLSLPSNQIDDEVRLDRYREDRCSSSDGVCCSGR
jgi:transposase-like protein